MPCSVLNGSAHVRLLRAGVLAQCGGATQARSLDCQRQGSTSTSAARASVQGLARGAQVDAS
eukprot:8575483-Alexandrium_andersonii.AAC.1